jgi:predicted metal-binding membrane protein
MPDAAQVAAIDDRDRLIVWTSVGLVTVLAWAYLVYLAGRMSASMSYDQMMQDMGMPMNAPWHAADVWFTFVMWAVMMVGMMAPSAAPVLVLFAAAGKALGRKGSIGTPVLAFASGYAIIWTAFSAAAALAQWALHETALLSPSMAASSGWLAGTILILAGLYQFTPIKWACLAHCRSPLGFLMGHWRNGVAGAIEMGVRHGTRCLGCCWALMCLLFVVGVMNLVWVAAIAAFVLIEKVGPLGRVASRLVGVASVLAGMFILTM